MNIPALIKIAALTDAERAWLEGQLEARQQYAEELNESGGNLGTSGKLVGWGGGGAGAVMAAKGLRQMFSKGKSTPTGFKRTPIFVKDAPNMRLPGQPAELLADRRMGWTGVPGPRPEGSAPTFLTRPGTGSTSYWRTWERQPTGGTVVPRAKVPPRAAGQRLAIKGGVLSLGSIGASMLLDHLADKHRAQAQKHENAGLDLTKQLGK